MNLDELITHLEVQTNILSEKQLEKARYEQGVRAMKEATNKEMM